MAGVWDNLKLAYRPYSSAVELSLLCLASQTIAMQCPEQFPVPSHLSKSYNWVKVSSLFHFNSSAGPHRAKFPVSQDLCYANISLWEGTEQQRHELALVIQVVAEVSMQACGLHIYLEFKTIYHLTTCSFCDHPIWCIFIIFCWFKLWGTKTLSEQQKNPMVRLTQEKM